MDTPTIPQDQLKTRCYSFLGVSAVLRSDSSSAIHLFDAMYSLFKVHGQPDDPIMCYILIEGQYKERPCAIIGTQTFQLFTGNLTLSHAHMLFFNAVINNITDHLLMHAGVVSCNNKGYIIAGPSAHGKTTFILKLVSEGFLFLSDEFCPVHIEKLHVTPFPRSIGIRETSPFSERLAPEAKMPVKNIGRGFKYIVSCNDIFPDSIGSVCTAKKLFLLTRTPGGNEDNAQYQHVDVALYKENRNLIDTLCSLKGVSLQNTSFLNDYIVHRFALTKKDICTQRFKTQCMLHKHDILYQERVYPGDPDFSQKPSLEPLSRTEATMEMLKNLRNRSPESKLLSDCSGSHARLFMKISEFIKTVDCYRLTVGNLDAMRELVCAA